MLKALAVCIRRGSATGGICLSSLFKYKIISNIIKIAYNYSKYEFY